MNVFPTSQEQGFRNCARLKNGKVARSFRLNKKTPDSPVPIDFLSFYIQTPCDILFSTNFCSYCFLFYLLKLTYVSFNRIKENPFEQKS